MMTTTDLTAVLAARESDRRALVERRQQAEEARQRTEAKRASVIEREARRAHERTYLPDNGPSDATLAELATLDAELAECKADVAFYDRELAMLDEEAEQLQAERERQRQAELAELVIAARHNARSADRYLAKAHRAATALRDVLTIITEYEDVHHLPREAIRPRYLDEAALTAVGFKVDSVINRGYQETVNALFPYDDTIATQPTTEDQKP